MTSTTTEHDNAKIIRGAFHAFEKGDLSRMMEICAEDALWHGAPGNTLISGEFKGRDEILKMFQTAAQATENTIKFKVRDVLANDEHAVALTSGSAHRKGLNIGGPSTFVFSMKDGKVVEVWVHGDTNLYPKAGMLAAAGKEPTWEDFWSAN